MFESYCIGVCYINYRSSEPLYIFSPQFFVWLYSMEIYLDEH